MIVAVIGLQDVFDVAGVIELVSRPETFHPHDIAELMRKAGKCLERVAPELGHHPEQRHAANTGRRFMIVSGHRFTLPTNKCRTQILNAKL